MASFFLDHPVGIHSAIKCMYKFANNIMFINLLCNYIYDTETDALTSLQCLLNIMFSRDDAILKINTGISISKQKFPEINFIALYVSTHRY